MPENVRTSYSQLSTWRRCRQRYAWHYLEGWRGNETPMALRRGSAGHSALAVWYKDLDETRAIQAAISRWKSDSPAITDQDVVELDKLITILKRYFDWSRTHDDFDEILAVEHPIVINLEEGIDFVGFIDLVVRRKGEVWLLDHKFQSKVDHSHLLLDTQISTYMAILGITADFDPPAGAIYNTIRTSVGGKAEGEPIARSVVRRSWHGARLAMDEIYRQSREIAALKNLSRDEASAFIYRNATRDCHWDCPFYAPCLGLEDSGEAETTFNASSFVRSQRPPAGEETGA